MDRYMVRRTRRSVERSYGVDALQITSPDGDLRDSFVRRVQDLHRRQSFDRLGSD